MFLWFIQVLVCISFIAQLYEYGTICWSILLLIDIWAVFIPWVLLIKLPQIFLYKSFYWHKFSFLFTKYLTAELLAHSGEGNGTPLQYSCLENPMDGVHGVATSRTRRSNFTFTFHFHALEKEMATHSSVLAWRIPGTGEPGGLPSMGSHRVGHYWSDLAAATAAAEQTNV